MKLKMMMALSMITLGLFAQKAPKGRLISYSHTIENPEIPHKSTINMEWNDGKGKLNIYERIL